jgi:hypothetical protein
MGERVKRRTGGGLVQSRQKLVQQRQPLKKIKHPQKKIASPNYTEISAV